MKTKILKPLLAMACLLSSINALAYDFEVDGIYYDVVSLSEFTCKVVKESKDAYYSGDVVIPAHVNYANKTLTVVEIEDGLFEECSELTGITIPNTITSISNYMFEGCKKLERVKIEDGETALKFGHGKEGLFYNCPITSLYVGRNLSYMATYSYGYSPFSGIKTLKEVTIGNSVTKIGNYEFHKCSGITSITIPNSVTEIGDNAFDGCSGLTSVTIGNSVTEIGSFAFYKCSGLTSVTIPNSVTEIGDYAFDGCSGLTSVTIPNSVTKIGDSTFEGCSGLTSVTIGNSVTKIGHDAFADCSSLTSITIPESVTEIGDNVFSGCGFTSITLPSSIKRIGAFDETDNITTIYILNPTPPSLSVEYYYNVPFTKNQYMTLNVYVPQGSLEAYQNADVWKNFWNLQEGAPTGIDNVKNITPNVNNHYYDLRGNRLSAPKRGLNIINGKKVIVK